jgi:hypothetical protein
VPEPVSCTFAETMQLSEGAGGVKISVVGSWRLDWPFFVPTPPPISRQTRSQLTLALWAGVAKRRSSICEGSLAVPDA